MKKTTFAGWFGAITPEEIEAIRAETNEREKLLAAFQNRERYEDSETDSENE